jgi:hypothetical protein
MATNLVSASSADTTEQSLNGNLLFDHPIEEMKIQCDKAGQMDPNGVHKVISPYLRMGISYYEDGRKQADKSFMWALIASGVGTLFFLLSLLLMIGSGYSSKSTISLIAGGIIQAISGLNFYLYAQTSRQLSSFHICLERVNRYIIANTFCDLLDDEHKHKMRSELIQVMATAPMLPVKGLTDNQLYREKQDSKVAAGEEE